MAAVVILGGLERLQQHIDDARTGSEFDEKVVRYMLEDVVKDAPLAVVLQLAEQMIAIRRRELKSEAQGN